MPAPKPRIRPAQDPMTTWCPLAEWPLTYPSESALRRRIERARRAGVRLEWARQVGRRLYVHPQRFLDAIDAAPSASEPAP
jgi:hypothetical protein